MSTRTVLRPPVMEFRNEWGWTERRIGRPGLDIRIKDHGVLFVEVSEDEVKQPFYLSREEAVRAATAIINAFPLDALGQA